MVDLRRELDAYPAAAAARAATAPSGKDTTVAFSLLAPDVQTTELDASSDDSESDDEVPNDGLTDDQSSPPWNNKGDSAWQVTAATLVCLQSFPGLVILYGGMVKKKWAVNSAFMVLYAFAAVLLCWVLWAHQMSFGTKLCSIVGVPDFALAQNFLLIQSKHGHMPMAIYVYYQFGFAVITVILLAGSLLGRMNFFAWMMFVPLWLTLCYTIGAFTIWGDGFLESFIIDYAGDFVIHLSSGVAGFTTAYWVIDMKT
ncbi:ammonium transporter 2 member 3-like [Carya illinoinensis]|uniref:ammonium transporter 2 member 3-like n=1 Tax=Carya illinoinensis TaxID=32201 RepID=UPI001C71DB3F|nr:ammonium transporter 2 member 3-like [Carya illinoinensis]